MVMELELVMLNQVNVHAQKDYGVQLVEESFHKMLLIIVQIIAVERVNACIINKLINFNALAIMITYWVIGKVLIALFQ